MVIVNPREIHRIFILDNAEYERIVIHVSDSMLKELSTAQTNLLRVFHKNRAHILHLSEEEMAQFVSNQLQMKKCGRKGIWSRSFRFCVVSDTASSDFTENASGRRVWSLGKCGRSCR